MTKGDPSIRMLIGNSNWGSPHMEETNLSSNFPQALL